MKNFLRTWLLPIFVCAITSLLLTQYFDHFLNLYLRQSSFFLKLLQIDQYSPNQQIQEIYAKTNWIRFWPYPITSGFITIFLMKTKSWRSKLAITFLSILIYPILIDSQFNPIMAVYLLIVASPAYVIQFATTVIGMYLGDFLYNRSIIRFILILSLVVMLPISILWLQHNPNPLTSTNKPTTTDPALINIKQNLLYPFCIEGQNPPTQSLTRFFTTSYLDRMTQDGRMESIGGKMQRLSGESELLNTIKYMHAYLFKLKDGLTCDVLLSTDQNTFSKRNESIEIVTEAYRNGQYHYSFTPFSNSLRHIWIANTPQGLKIDHISGTN